MACIIIQLGCSLAPFSLTKSLKDPPLTLENSIRYVSNRTKVESGQIIRQNGTGKCTVKALAFYPRRRASLLLSMVA